MALRTIAITPLPLLLDGTTDRPRWGEDNAPYAVPPNIDTGLGGEVLPSATVNYNWQQPASVTRAILESMVFSDEGLFTTCVVSQGAWNTSGGTLSITLERTRLVIDVAQDGGTVFELIATLGDPEILPALSDSYIDIKDDGTVTVVSVANGQPEPPVTAASVRTYKLVTDAAELTAVTLDPEVAPFPCLGPNIGVSNAFIGELAVTDGIAAKTITASVSISSDKITTTGLATLASLEVEGDTTLGLGPGQLLSCLATPTFTAVVNAPAGVRGSAGVRVDFPDGAAVAAAKLLELLAGASVVGDASTSITTGTVDTIGAAGVAKVGSLAMYPVAQGAGSGTNGEINWDGTTLTLGVSAVARTIAVPIESEIAGTINTVNGIDDTGALVILGMFTGETVTVEMTSEMTNSDAVPLINFRIEANAVIIGGSQNRRPSVSNQYIGCNRKVHYVAGADGLVTFKARFGANNGTTSAVNVMLSLTRTTP